MQIPGPDPRSNELKFKWEWGLIKIFILGSRPVIRHSKAWEDEAVVLCAGWVGRLLFCCGYTHVAYLLLDRNFLWRKNRVHHRVRVSTDKNALYETYPNLEHKEHATWHVCSRKPTSPSQMPGSCQNLQGEFCLLCKMPSRFQGSFRNTVTQTLGQIQSLTYMCPLKRTLWSQYSVYFYGPSIGFPILWNTSRKKNVLYYWILFLCFPHILYPRPALWLCMLHCLLWESLTWLEWNKHFR